jgi:hypothetical protein
MTNTIIEFLENIQLDCIKKRFGNDYEKEILRLVDFNSKLISDSFINRFKSFYNLSDHDITELSDLASENFRNIKVLNTKYSIHAQNLILDSLFQKIYNTVVRLKYTVQDTPFAGTAVSGEYNAFACIHPTSHEKLIVFESELIIVANLFCKIIALSIPIDIKDNNVGFSIDLKSLEEHLDRNKHIIEKFTELFYYTIYKGFPSNAKQYFIQSSHQKLFYELLNSFELFIIGHEYGHVLAGHLSNKVFIRKISGVNINIIETNWKEEFEADSIGLNLLLNSLDKSNLGPFCYLGPEIFFIFLDLIDRISSYLNEGLEISDAGSITHPPSVDRKLAIREYLNNSLKSDDYIAYRMVSDFVNDIANTLWNKLKNKISVDQ